ncbi:MULTISPECIES: GNAT family N-acetyltransferase [Acutalibacteraceae]|uniref:GNAT family N-acetyltransferase n=1 Tax=Acutalibacteraceae TaxID=3082771 RepID=UPI002E0DDC46|nr:GNAT family N-acetyltransferase [Caproicibacter sp. BJN0012]
MGSCNWRFISIAWVSGAFKGKGYAKQLLSYCIDDAKKQGKSGVCILTSKRKTLFYQKRSLKQSGGSHIKKIASLKPNFGLVEPQFQKESRSDSTCP